MRSRKRGKLDPPSDQISWKKQGQRCRGSRRRTTFPPRSEFSLADPPGRRPSQPSQPRSPDPRLRLWRGKRAGRRMPPRRGRRDQEGREAASPATSAASPSSAARAWRRCRGGKRGRSAAPAQDSGRGL